MQLFTRSARVEGCRSRDLAPPSSARSGAGAGFHQFQYRAGAPENSLCPRRELPRAEGLITSRGPRSSRRRGPTSPRAPEKIPYSCAPDPPELRCRACPQADSRTTSAPASELVPRPRRRRLQRLHLILPIRSETGSCRRSPVHLENRMSVCHHVSPDHDTQRRAWPGTPSWHVRRKKKKKKKKKGSPNGVHELHHHVSRGARPDQRSLNGACRLACEEHEDSQRTPS